MAKAYCDGCLKFYLNRRSPENKKPPLTDFLCNDCEKYLCSKCIAEHTDHELFSVQDKSNKNTFDRFCGNMMTQLTSEGDQTLEKFTQERTHLCDIVDVVGEEMCPQWAGDVDFSVMDICILRECKKWAVTDLYNKCIKVFNINNNQMTAIIHLVNEPKSITEVPSTDPSQSLIAVSFLYEEQIDIMDISSEPAQVISSISVQGKCRDLAYCNNKLITRFTSYLHRDWRESIHVIGMTGEIINIINPHNIPGTQRNRSYLVKMCVHSESETIYVCQYDDPPCVISLSLDGQVLHSVNFIALEPRHICVDRDQTVYVMGNDNSLYKLSSDLSQKEKVIDKGLNYGLFIPLNPFRSIACHADTLYIVRSEGRVGIIRHE